MSVLLSIVAISIVFGLSFALNYLTFNDLAAFIAYFCIFTAFFVYGGAIDMWFLILNIIIVSVLIYYRLFRE